MNIGASSPRVSLARVSLRARYCCPRTTRGARGAACPMTSGGKSSPWRASETPLPHVQVVRPSWWSAFLALPDDRAKPIIDDDRASRSETNWISLRCRHRRASDWARAESSA